MISLLTPLLSVVWGAGDAGGALVVKAGPRKSFPTREDIRVARRTREIHKGMDPAANCEYPIFVHHGFQNTPAFRPSFNWRLLLSWLSF